MVRYEYKDEEGNIHRVESCDERFTTQTAYAGPRGGTGHLPDLSNKDKIAKRDWNYNAPEWRKAVEGLSLEGR